MYIEALLCIPTPLKIYSHHIVTFLLLWNHFKSEASIRINKQQLALIKSIHDLNGKYNLKYSVQQLMMGPGADVPLKVCSVRYQLPYILLLE